MNSTLDNDKFAGVAHPFRRGIPLIEEISWVAEGMTERFPFNGEQPVINTEESVP